MFDAAVDKNMQIIWAAPSVKLVTVLERVEHFNDIVAEGKEYQGYLRTMANIAKAYWHWQVDVPCPIEGSVKEKLPICYRGGVF